MLFEARKDDGLSLVEKVIASSSSTWRRSLEASLSLFGASLVRRRCLLLRPSVPFGRALLFPLTPVLVCSVDVRRSTTVATSGQLPGFDHLSTMA